MLPTQNEIHRSSYAIGGAICPACKAVSHPIAPAGVAPYEKYYLGWPSVASWVAYECTCGAQHSTYKLKDK